MHVFKWNVRSAVNIVLALVLTVSVGCLGIWLLLGGEPGTGLMENNVHLRMVESGEHERMMSGSSVYHPMMGAPANQGILGGYTGSVGLIMILVFLALVSLLVYSLWRERPAPVQSGICWNCTRPVETDWTTCPYCGVSLEGERRLPQGLVTP